MVENSSWAGPRFNQREEKKVGGGEKEVRKGRWGARGDVEETKGMGKRQRLG